MTQSAQSSPTSHGDRGLVRCSKVLYLKSLAISRSAVAVKGSRAPSRSSPETRRGPCPPISHRRKASGMRNLITTIRNDICCATLCLKRWHGMNRPIHRGHRKISNMIYFVMRSRLALGFDRHSTLRASPPIEDSL
jgi:hypothetical protein